VAAAVTDPTVTAISTATATSTTATTTTTVPERAIYASGSAQLDQLLITSRNGALRGANVYLTLEEQQYITNNRIIGNVVNNPGGSDGQIQYNDNGLFGGSANMTFDGSNVVVGGIKTDNYYYANGSPFSGGGGGGNTFSSITMTSTPSGAANNIQYGLGNLFVWNDGGWTIGEYNGEFSGTEGIRINPDIEGPTDITLPAAQVANTQPTSISNFLGNVVVNTGNSNQWKFGDLGTLTTPGGLTIDSLGQITAASNSVVSILANGVSGGFLVDYYGNTNTDANTSGGEIALNGGPNVELTIGLSSDSGNGSASRVWRYNTAGQTSFPILTTARGDSTSSTITGYTLLGGTGDYEFVISTPDGIGGDSQRLVINPGKGADGTSGEGGDIYLWAGRGGSGDVANLIGGGSGGDIKIRGGQGMAHGEGGYIRIEAGDGDNQNSPGGYPGFIEITGGQGGNTAPGGYIHILAGTGDIIGGDANLTAGTGLNGPGGNVNITAGGSGNGLAEYGNINISVGANSWAFDNNGNLTLTQGSTINDEIDVGTTLTVGKSPTVIAISGADFTSVNLTYTINPNDNTTWIPPGYNPVTDPYIQYGGGEWGIFVPGFGQALYVNTGPLWNPLTQWNINPPLGSVAPTGVYTYTNPAWTFGTDGTTTSGSGLQDIPIDVYLPGTPFNGTVLTQALGDQIQIVARGVGGAAAVGWIQTPSDGVNPPAGGVASVDFNSTANSVGITSGSFDTTVYSWTFGEDGTLTLPYTAAIKTTSDYAIAIGVNAGLGGSSAVSLGYGAGGNAQSFDAIAIGGQAGANTQGGGAIAIGGSAGNDTQGAGAIAIGPNAGQFSQGTLAIAIGASAGYNVQASSSIVINATGAELNNTTANSLVIDPVRNDVSNVGNVMFYNAVSKEITYGNTISLNGNITADTFISNSYNVVTAGNLSITSQYGLGVTGTILEDGGTLELIGSGTGLGTTGCVIVGWNSSYGNGLGAVAQIYFNPPGSSGNAVITTGDLAGTSYDWTFDDTGNLTTPGSGGDINLTGGNITGVNVVTANVFAFPHGSNITEVASPVPGNYALALAGTGTVDPDQQLLIYPTSLDANHLHLTSGNLYNTELFLGNDNLYVKLANTGNVVINSNNGGQFVFSTDYTISFPDSGLTIDSGYNSATAGFVAEGGIGLRNTQLYNSGNVASQITLTRPGIPSAGDNFVQIAVHEDNANAPYTWTFNKDGNLTLPGNTFAVNYANGTPVSLGGGSYGDANVANFLSSFGSNSISTTGNVSASDLSATGNASVLTLTTRNGDSQNSNASPQIIMGYAGTGNYPQFIHTTHNANSPVNNNIEFWTSDGTQAGTFPANAVLGLTVSNGNISSGNISTTGNVLGNGYARFVGAFDESQASTAGLYLGYAGGTPRIMFGTGTTSQTFEIDNDSGTLRFYQPGSTKASLTANGVFTANVVVTTPKALSSLTAVAGARAFVDDGNLVAAGNFGAQIGGGGSNIVPVWSNGTNWYIG
jgi:hypothetical protein